jgi:hypothetical protein
VNDSFEIIPSYFDNQPYEIMDKLAVLHNVQLNTQLREGYSFSVVSNERMILRVYLMIFLKYLHDVLKDFSSLRERLY